jgi:hypothetical protein
MTGHERSQLINILTDKIIIKEYLTKIEEIKQLSLPTQSKTQHYKGNKINKTKNNNKD